MVRVDCSGTWYGSQLDEQHVFEWALQIPGVVRWEADSLIVRSNLSEASLRDLVALLWRYQVPMSQLRVFLNARNRSWFGDPKMYWHRQVFSRQPNKRLQRTTAGAATNNGASLRNGRRGGRR